MSLIHHGNASIYHRDNDYSSPNLISTFQILVEYFPTKVIKLRLEGAVEKDLRSIYFQDSISFDLKLESQFLNVHSVS